jgi:hypothetical protein
MLLSVIKSQCRQKLCNFNNSADAKSKATSDYYQNLHYFCQSWVFDCTLHTAHCTGALETRILVSVNRQSGIRFFYEISAGAERNRVIPKRFSSLLPFIRGYHRWLPPFLNIVRFSYIDSFGRNGIFRWARCHELPFRWRKNLDSERFRFRPQTDKSTIEAWFHISNSGPVTMHTHRAAGEGCFSTSKDRIRCATVFLIHTHFIWQVVGSII